MEAGVMSLAMIMGFAAGWIACRAVHKRVPTRRATDLMSVYDELQTIKRLVATVVNIADRTAHEHQQRVLRLSSEAVERTRLRHHAKDRRSQGKSHLETGRPVDRDVI
jgi:hypothetical protein